MIPDAAHRFAERINVSRETLERLSVYVALLERWQKRINLVGPATVAQVWTRHILDSAQLALWLGPSPGICADIGSGAGFPGLVLALLLEGADGAVWRLIESDVRKGAFLREVIRHTGARAEVITARIEGIDDFKADTITARALAPLPKLLALAENIAHPQTRLVLLKGQDVDRELTEAAKSWIIDVEVKPSLTDPSGHILVIERFQRGAAS